MIQLQSLISESYSVRYKGKTYYIENPKGKKSVFAFSDKVLTKNVKVNGGTLIFQTKDIQDKLKT